MTNEDFKLEELENAAVQKSNKAKRMAALAAGLVGTAGVTGTATYAATTHNNGDPVLEEPLEDLEASDLDSVAEAGARQVEKPEIREETPSNHHAGEKKVIDPVEPKDNDVDVNFDKTTHVYDENGELVLTTEEGTIDGKQFKLIDLDNDQRADYVAYDVNGDGKFGNDEMVELTGKDQIAMGNKTQSTDNIYVVSNDPQPDKVEIYDIDEKNDYAYEHDTFNEDKSGQLYDPTGESESENSYAYEEDGYKDEKDYGYGELADNTGDDAIDDLGNDSFDLV